MPESYTAALPFRNGLRAAAVFFFISAIYIIVSDTLMADLAQDSLRAGIVKGLLYVGLASALIFVLVYRSERRNEEHIAKLMERTQALVTMESRQQTALLASTVIHDIRNAVGAMHLNIKSLLKETDMTADTREIAGDLDELSERLMDLTERLRPVDRRPPIFFDPVVHTNDFVQVFKRSLHGKHPVACKKAGQPTLLYGNKTLYERMLGNLLSNAVEASHEDGAIEVAMHTEANDFVLEVRDYGVGIDEAQLENIWEPLFTTKAHGTGLGLSVVREAVDTFGGKLAITSDAGSGTCFRIQLPAAPTRAGT